MKIIASQIARTSFGPSRQSTSMSKASLIIKKMVIKTTFSHFNVSSKLCVSGTRRYSVHRWCGVQQCLPEFIQVVCFDGVGIHSLNTRVTKLNLILIYTNYRIAKYKNVFWSFQAKYSKGFLCHIKKNMVLKITSSAFCPFVKVVREWDGAVGLSVI